MLSKSKLERKGAHLYEVLPSGVKLELGFDDQNIYYKKKLSKKFEEKC